MNGYKNPTMGGKKNFFSPYPGFVKKGFAPVWLDEQEDFSDCL
jgi:hypothetical protein